MKPKLENIQDALKILEKEHGYEIPKQWYRVEFPKTIKRKKKIDTVWKDYTIILFAKKWIYACGNAIANKMEALHDENFKMLELYVKNKSYPWKVEKVKMKRKMYNPATRKHEMIETVFIKSKGDSKFLRHQIVDKVIFAESNEILKKEGKKPALAEDYTSQLSSSSQKKYEELYEKTYTSYKLLKSLIDGFGISKIGGKHYLQDKFDEREEFEDISEIKEIKHLKTIIKLPEKIDTAKAIVEGEFYWKQWFKLYKEKIYNKKSYEKPEDVLKNNNILRKETRTLYKRYMKIRKERKYNLNFFVNHEPKNKKFWISNWHLFSKIE